MATVRDWWRGLWDTVKHSPAILPTRHVILPANTDKGVGQRFRRDKHYFEVRVNRIFLKYSRDFWATYAPMALVVSEFNYKGQDVVVPFVVGPSVLEKDKVELPNGFVFSDTRVAGIHAYKGDGLKLTVILYQVKRNDLAKRLLKVTENLATVLEFSQALDNYLKLANVLVDIVGELIGTDRDNKPIIGLRKEFTDADNFTPGYLVLIDSGGDRIEQSKLWVRNRELLYGENDSTAGEFTGANYVLYSIGQTAERQDFDKLPFYEQWKTTLAESFTADPEQWKSALANWTTLYQMMSLSPDLTLPHAEKLAETCYEQMVRNHEKVKEKVSKVGRADGTRRVPGQDTELRRISARLDRVRKKSVSVLRKT